jgi:hypothetical protein
MGSTPPNGDLQLASEPDITDPVTVRGHGFPIRSQPECQWQTGKQPLAVTVKVSRSEFKFFAAAALRLVATDRDSHLTPLSHDRDSSQCGPAGAAGRRVSLSQAGRPRRRRPGTRGDKKIHGCQRPGDKIRIREPREAGPPESSSICASCQPAKGN